MSNRTQLWYFCDLYRRTFNEWKDREGAWEAHLKAEQAVRAAKFRLTSEEEKRAYAWIDERMPGRHKPPERPQAPMESLWESEGE